MKRNTSRKEQQKQPSRGVQVFEYNKLYCKWKDSRGSCFVDTSFVAAIGMQWCRILNFFNQNHCTPSLPGAFRVRAVPGVFLWILRNFQEQLFYRTPLGDCF